MDDRIDDLLSDAAREYHEPPATPRAEMWERIEAARAADRKDGKAEGRKEGTAGALIPAAAIARRRPFPSFRPSVLPPWLGIAALLALGIGIGRWMERRHAPAPTVAQRPATSAPAAAPDTSNIPVNPPETKVAEAPHGGATRFIPARAGQPAATHSDVAYSVALNQHLGQSEMFLTLFRNSVKVGHVEPVAFATARQLLSTNRLLLDSRIGADPHTRQLLEDLELVLAQIAQLRAGTDSSDTRIITDGMDEGDVLPRLRIAVPAGT